MAPHITNFLLGSFGIVAAVLLVGGSIVLRAQRERNRFELAKRAIENGLPFPSGLPAWVASRRQALSLLACGGALILVGAATWWLGSGSSMPSPVQSNVSEPTSAVTTSASAPTDAPRPPPPPTPPSPALEAWHSDQERIVVGQTALGCGVILAVLGMVRLAYTRTERRFSESQATANQSAD